MPVTPPPFAGFFFKQKTCNTQVAKTERGGRHDNLVSSLFLTRCEPSPSLKNASYTPGIYRSAKKLVIQCYFTANCTYSSIIIKFFRNI